MATVGRKHVVHALGAGFSAPLGIPTIATFLDRAKTLQEEDTGSFASSTRYSTPSRRSNEHTTRTRLTEPVLKTSSRCWT